jgi:hypothetical protein
MNYKTSLILVTVGIIAGFLYTDKPADSKLKCERCNNSYFTVSNKTAKFVGTGDSRHLKCGLFYKCTKCGVLSDVVASK